MANKDFKVKNGIIANDVIESKTGFKFPDGTTQSSAGTSVTTSSTPPSPASNGDLWWDSERGELRIYYNDGDSSQWVASSLIAGPTGPIGLTGATGVTGQTGATGPVTAAIVCVIDNFGAAITTGIKTDISIPFSGIITEWTLLADQSGSIVIDIWKDTYANYPPTVADTITGSAKPTITSATKNTSSTLTGWTTTFNAGDIFRFNVDSATTITRATLTLKVTKTS